jgi:hypothetical protein
MKGTEMSCAVTKSPMTVEEFASGLTAIGWAKTKRGYELDGWLLCNLRTVESAESWGGKTHTLMDIRMLKQDAGHLLEFTICSEIPTWAPDDGDDYRLGWTDDD